MSIATTIFDVSILRNANFQWGKKIKNLHFPLSKKGKFIFPQMTSSPFSILSVFQDVSNSRMST